MSYLLIWKRRLAVIIAWLGATKANYEAWRFRLYAKWYYLTYVAGRQYNSVQQPGLFQAAGYAPRFAKLIRRKPKYKKPRYDPLVLAAELIRLGRYEFAVPRSERTKPAEWLVVKPYKPGDELGKDNEQ